MRTTLNLDDDLMRAVKELAAQSGRTLTSIIESALRELLHREKAPPRPFRFEWTVLPGGARPGVDLTDRDGLIDLMEGRE